MTDQLSSRALFARYLFATVCLAAIIVFHDYRTESVIHESLEELTDEVRMMDRQWCEAINRMHKVKGYTVMDCRTGHVRLVPVAASVDEE